MPTDTEAAQAMRVIAAWHLANNRPHLANLEDDRADELDPPKPTYPDGTYAAVTCANDFVTRSYFARRVNGEWVTADGRGLCDDQDVTKVEPLRVLADDEIAVGIMPFTETPEKARRYAAELHDAQFGVASLLYRRIADALDAETGGRS